MKGIVFIVRVNIYGQLKLCFICVGWKAHLEIRSFTFFYNAFVFNVYSPLLICGLTFERIELFNEIF